MSLIQGCQCGKIPRHSSYPINISKASKPNELVMQKSQSCPVSILPRHRLRDETQLANPRTTLCKQNIGTINGVGQRNSRHYRRRNGMVIECRYEKSPRMHAPDKLGLSFVGGGVNAIKATPSTMPRLSNRKFWKDQEGRCAKIFADKLFGNLREKVSEVVAERLRLLCIIHTSRNEYPPPLGSLSACPVLSLQSPTLYGTTRMVHKKDGGIRTTNQGKGIDNQRMGSSTEQSFNLKLLIDYLGIRIQLCLDMSVVPYDEHVQRVMRRMLAEEEGKSMRNRAQEIRKLAQKAIGKGGSSPTNL
eukprot:Gb_11271 [translate_table: standard]